MFQPTSAFSGFSVNDLAQAKALAGFDFACHSRGQRASGGRGTGLPQWNGDHARWADPQGGSRKDLL